VPVKFLGVGEGIDDLEKFVVKDYVDAILNFEDEGAA
jgi:signal recognition particle GTPase